MKILVTGGAGFIGSNIVDRYISLGHQVVIADDLSSGKKEFINPQAVFYQADIRDRARVSEIFEKERPVVLNHHAAQMEVRRSVAQPQFDAEVNIIGLLNLLEAGRLNGLKKVIFASSGGAVYGDAGVLPTSETYSARPVSPYGISKLTSEHYLWFYKLTYGIEAISLRYGNVYGPRQNPHGEAGVVAIFAQKMLKKEQPMINGDGEQSRDFVYVGDVVEANVAALSLNQTVSVNVGTGIATTINTIFDTLVRLTKASLKRQYAQEKPGEQRKSLSDIKLAGQLLSWKPQVSLQEGLTKTVEFFQNEK